MPIMYPEKKPRGGKLNRYVNRKRILVEHAIGGVKRYGIVREISRYRLGGWRIYLLVKKPTISRNPRDAPRTVLFNLSGLFESQKLQIEGDNSIISY